MVHVFAKSDGKFRRIHLSRRLGFTYILLNSPKLLDWFHQAIQLCGYKASQQIKACVV